MNDKQKQVLERKVQRVEKALAALGATAGTYREAIKTALIRRLNLKLLQAVGRLKTEEDPFSFDDLKDPIHAEFETQFYSAGIQFKEPIQPTDPATLQATSGGAIEGEADYMSLTKDVYTNEEEKP